MLAILDGGTSYHRDAIYGERYAAQFDRAIYAPDLTAAHLDDVGLLIVPDRINPDLLRRHKQILIDFLSRGRSMVVFGETQSETWLPGVRWTSRPTNFWWWLEKDAVAPQQLTYPEHEIFQHVPFEDTIWHFHGVLAPPEGATPLITVPMDRETGDIGGALLYEDRVSTAGRLIVSTLDPFYHHGSNFMPATTRFLDGFLPWAREAANGHAERPSARSAVGRG